MPNLHFASRRALAAPAAVLVLALLGGCESTASNGNNRSTNTDVASANATNGAVAGEPMPASLSEGLVQVGDRVHFALDRYDLSLEAEAMLQKQAALLRQFGPATVTIEGHADERGTREYNLALGERRGDSVRNYLIALGVAPERVSVISYGKERPECVEAAESCWAQNRRGVTVVNP